MSATGLDLRASSAPAGGPRLISHTRGRTDRVYRSVTTGAALVTLGILVLIGLFLALQALPTFRRVGLAFFWIQVSGPDNVNFNVAHVLYWTVVIAAIALFVALVVSIPCALYVTEYAPQRIRRFLVGLVDLLAAIPSVIYGIWGLAYLEPHLAGPDGLSAWLSKNLGFIPIFQAPRANYAGSALIAGLVVSIMVMPICTSVMREVFSQTPPGEKEAALALGATRWGMIRSVVLPFGRGGIIGGAMLGLGRALGETIAVSLIISPVPFIDIHWVQSGANSIAAMIALLFGQATQGYGIPALMAAGLTLFGVTLIVNFLASLIVARSRSGRGVEI